MLYIKELGDYDTAVVIDTDDMVEEIVAIENLLNYAKVLKIYGVDVETNTVTPFDMDEYIVRYMARDKVLGIESKYSSYNGVFYLEYVDMGSCRQYRVADGTYYLGFGNMEHPVFTSKYPFEVILPVSCKKIQYQAFKGTRISKINLSHVEAIGDKAFQNCQNLKEVCLNNVYVDGEDPPDLGKYCFDSSGVQSVSLGEATFIPAYCFNNCENLKTIKARNVRVIDDMAFYDCVSLNSIELGDSLENIGMNAFYDCPSLARIDLQSVRYISSNAFFYCDSLKSVDIRNLDVESSGISVFNATNLQSVVLPKSCRKMSEVDLYKHLAISSKETKITYI